MTLHLDPNDFTTVIDNPFFTLQPGTTYVYESLDGSTATTFVVTHQTRVIDGVTCVVVEDTVTVNGEILEHTVDFFAQNKNGDVWYFGEHTTEFENGHAVHEGAWKSGVHDATAGIIMLASPDKGDAYQQENAPGVAEDMAEIVSLKASGSTPYGSFSDMLKIAETTPLDPGALEFKFYAEGVGLLFTQNAITGEIEQLTKIIVDGTSSDDTLFGYAGPDEMNGAGGNDAMTGGSGDDLLQGGAGADELAGGPGNDTFIFADISDSRPKTPGADLLIDFATVADTIDLSLIDASTQKGFSGDQAFLWGGESAAVVANSITFFQDEVNNMTIIQGDVNGDGVADLEIDLASLMTPDVRDFIL
jgi:Peptidase M10 serralysin C terminal